MKIKEMLTETATKITDNKGGILTGVTIVGAVATTALTAIAAWKVKDIIDKNNGVIDKNVIKDCVKVAILPGGALLITIFSAYGAHKAEVVKYGTLAALYASDSKKVQELTDKLSKKNPEIAVKDGKLVKESNDELAAENKTSAYNEDPNILENVNPKELNKKRMIFDKYTGQFLECTINDILRAINNTNAMINDGKDKFSDEVSRVYAWDTFYEDLGVELRGSMNKSVGWTEDDGQLSVIFDGAIDDNMQLYYTFRFDTEPHDIDAENPNKWKRY